MDILGHPHCILFLDGDFVVRQELIAITSDTPTYMVDFDTIVYRGYDYDAERNKTESISLRKYPLCLYSSYRQILQNTDNPKIQYIADIQRYSVILGHAIIEHQPWYSKIKDKYSTDVDSDSDFVQEKIDTTLPYMYKTSTRNIRRNIKILHYLQESIETMSNILSINTPDLVVLCSLYGISKSTSISKYIRTKVDIEVKNLNEFIEYKIS